MRLVEFKFAIVGSDTGAQDGQIVSDRVVHIVQMNNGTAIHLDTGETVYVREKLDEVKRRLESD